MSYLGAFRSKLEKTIAIFEISTFEFVRIQSFMLNKKTLIFDQNCLIYIYLDWNLEKLLSYLKSAPSSSS